MPTISDSEIAETAARVWIGLFRQMDNDQLVQIRERSLFFVDQFARPELRFAHLLKLPLLNAEIARRIPQPAGYPPGVLAKMSLQQRVARAIAFELDCSVSWQQCLSAAASVISILMTRPETRALAKERHRS